MKRIVARSDENERHRHLFLQELHVLLTLIFLPVVGQVVLQMFPDVWKQEILGKDKAAVPYVIDSCFQTEK